MLQYLRSGHLRQFLILKRFDWLLTFADPNVGMAQEASHLTHNLPRSALGQEASVSQSRDRCKCLDNDRFLDICNKGRFSHGTKC